ncbi:hypothetical protein ACT7C9_32400 [Bacillus cereus]
MNKEFKTTIILTSHDSGDIELLCQKAIVINKGSIIFNDDLSILSEHYFTHKRVYVRFKGGKLPKIMPLGVEIINAHGNELELKVNTKQHSCMKVIQVMMNYVDVEDFTVVAPTMDDVIHQIFSEQHVNTKRMDKR